MRCMHWFLTRTLRYIRFAWWQARQARQAEPCTGSRPACTEPVNRNVGRQQRPFPTRWASDRRRRHSRLAAVLVARPHPLPPSLGAGVQGKQDATAETMDVPWSRRSASGRWSARCGCSQLRRPGPPPFLLDNTFHSTSHLALRRTGRGRRRERQMVPIRSCQVRGPHVDHGDSGGTCWGCWGVV